MLEKTTINGFTYSHQCFTMRITGLDDLELTGVKSINYKATNNRGKIYGNSPRRLASTVGQMETSGSLELALAEFELLTTRLGNGWTEKAFDLIIEFMLPGGDKAGATPVRHVLKTCTLISPDHSSTEGTDATTVKLDLDYAELQHNSLMSRYNTANSSAVSEVKFGASLVVPVAGFNVTFDGTLQADVSATAFVAGSAGLA